MLSKYLTHHILRTQSNTEFAASGEAKLAASSEKEEANPQTLCSSPSPALPALVPYKSTINSRTSAVSSIVVKRKGKVSEAQNPAIICFIPQE